MLKLAGGAAQALQPEVASRLAARRAGGQGGGFAALIDAGTRAPERQASGSARVVPGSPGRASEPPPDVTAPRRSAGDAGAARPGDAARADLSRRHPPKDTAAAAADPAEPRLPGDPPSSVRDDGMSVGQDADDAVSADTDPTAADAETGHVMTDGASPGQGVIEGASPGQGAPNGVTPSQLAANAATPGLLAAGEATALPPLPMADGQDLPAMGEVAAAAAQPPQSDPVPEGGPRVDKPRQPASSAGANPGAMLAGQAIATAGLATESTVDASGDGVIAAAAVADLSPGDAAPLPDAAAPVDTAGAGPDLPLPTAAGTAAAPSPGLASPAASAPPPLPAQQQGMPEPPRLPASALQQLTARIVHASGGEVTSIAVDLRPPELGRVSLRVTFQDGAVHVAVAAARPETLAALQNDRALLTQQLEQAGINLAGGGLDFRQGNLPQQATAQPDAAQAAPGDGRAGAESSPGPAPRRSRSDSLFDLFA